MRSLCTKPSLGKQPLPQTARKSNKQPATGGLADTTYAIIILLYRLVTPLPRFRAQNEPSLHDTSFTDPAVTLFLFNSPVLSLQAHLPASSPGACDTSLVPVRDQSWDQFPAGAQAHPVALWLSDIPLSFHGLLRHIFYHPIALVVVSH